MIEEIVAEFNKIQKLTQETQNITDTSENELLKLHEEFSWLVADIGIKEPLARSSIYGIE